MAIQKYTKLTSITVLHIKRYSIKHIYNTVLCRILLKDWLVIFCLLNVIFIRILSCVWSKSSEFDFSFGHQCWGDLSMLIFIGYMCLMLCAPIDWHYAELPSSASGAVMCSVLVRKMWTSNNYMNERFFTL